MKLALAILFLPVSLLAQEFAITDTIFLDADWNVTKNRSEAIYYRGTLPNPKDSTILVHDYYLETFTIQMIGVYKNRVKPQNQVGEFQYFYKNGNLRAIYNYNGGSMNGTSILYFENGNKEVLRKFKNGQLTDTLLYFYESGLLKEMRIINPQFDSENLAEAEKATMLIEYRDAQNKTLVSNGSGTKIEYYPNGEKRQTIEYFEGFPHGEWIQYGQNKKIISKMNFKNGKFISGLMYPKKKKDIFATLYREPRFSGGIKALDEYTLKNSGKCKEELTSDVSIIIRISENGTPEFDQVISGDVSHCQYEELEELVNKMPKWTPAVRYGKYVESTYVLRVKY